MPAGIEDRIRAKLLDYAKAKQIVLVPYGTLAAELGEHVMAVSNRTTLNRIADREKSNNRPDITFILKNRRTGYPGQIGGKRAHPPSPEQKQRAKAEMQEIIREYSPCSSNPYP